MPSPLSLTGAARVAASIADRGGEGCGIRAPSTVHDSRGVEDFVAQAT